MKGFRPRTVDKHRISEHTALQKDVGGSVFNAGSKSAEIYRSTLPLPLRDLNLCYVLVKIEIDMKYICISTSNTS